ncbi:hypothetical protein [Allorhizobium terrae]|uniref:Uncharacterized protein n=1 Tax=Allorhizobium terrae TaxID=1848972 RepID=A0A4S4A5G7_9HYPH|nr:hypothetical protein [Allorhizobium terrae]THF53768.1 hypothetical protein E6C51_01210 [Allorhizobium terrae]TWD54342.1 hypothetical protein FB480_103251 [Agrobacterium vitis]
MAAKIPRPPLDGLKRQIDRYRQGQKGAHNPAFIRETFCLNREDARIKAREWFDAFPRAAYWTEIESWRRLEDDRIEFTMRRLSSAD